MTRAHWIAVAAAAVILGAHILAVAATARALYPKYRIHRENPKP